MSGGDDNPKMKENMKDENKSQAQLIKELQLIRQHVAELEQDKVRYQQLTKQLLFENDESVREYFDIYFHAYDMIVSVDVNTDKVLRCSKAVMERLGFGRAEIVGHPIFKLYHQDCVEDAKELFRVIAETGETHDAEQTLRKRDGGKINVSLNAKTVHDENGNPTLARFDWRDITRRAGERGFINGAFRDNDGKVYPLYPDVVYVKWGYSVTYDEGGNPTPYRYIATSMGTHARDFNTEDFVTGDWETMYPGTKFVAYDDAGYDPYTFLTDDD